MEPQISERFNYTAQKFIGLLEEMKRHSTSIESHKIEDLEESIESVRVKLLEKEIREKYPDAETDSELLKLVGTAPNLSLEKEKDEIREAIASTHGGE